MSQNDFLTFSAATGANVLSQSDYASASSTATGYVTGTASSAAVNKTLRQTTLICHMTSQFIVDYSGQNAIDDGTTATLEANFVTAIQAVAGTRIINIPDVVGLTTALAGKLSTTGNAASASRLNAPVNIALTGQVNGATNFDGSGNVSIACTIPANALSISNTNGLQAALDSKQPNLGFTPVQQSGGAGQVGNKVYIGWSASGLKAQVDATDLGSFVFSSGFSSSLGVNGWMKRPDGVIEQWGHIGINGQSTQNVSYNIPFPNAALNIMVSKGSSIATTGEPTVGADLAGNSAFNIRNSSGQTGSQGIYWRAIGY